MEPAFNLDVVAALRELRHLLLTQVVVEASPTSQTWIKPWLYPCLLVAADSLATESWSGEELGEYLDHARHLVLDTGGREGLNVDLLNDLRDRLDRIDLPQEEFSNRVDEMRRAAALTLLEAILSGALTENTVAYGDFAVSSQ